MAKENKNLKISKNGKKFNIIAVCALIFVLALFYVPCLWAIAQTFKTRGGWMEDIVGFPKTISFSNYGLFFNYFYVNVIKNGIPRHVFFEETVLNTILFAGGSALTSFIVKFMISYALYKYKCFKESAIIYTMLILIMNIPLAGGQASSLKLYHQLGLYDNLFGMWFLKGTGVGFFVLVFYATFGSIPAETYEAAEIDGANRLQLMFKIAMPLLKSTIILFFLTEFIGYWNNYMDILLLLPSMPTVGLALFYFNQATNPPEIAHATVKLTGAFICALPMVVVLIFFGDKLMQNVSITEGVKG